MTSPTLLAEWGHDPTCSSRTCPGCCLLTAGTLWPVVFTDWPASATWDHGGLYELPTSEPVTDGPDGSALLATPTAHPPGGSTEDYLARKAAHGGMGVSVTDLRMQVDLLATPTAWLGRRPVHSDVTNDSVIAGTGREVVRDIASLLPTPTARDHKDGASMTADVAENALLGRTVWNFYEPPDAAPPSNDGNTSSDDPHRTRSTGDD